MEIQKLNPIEKFIEFNNELSTTDEGRILQAWPEFENIYFQFVLDFCSRYNKVVDQINDYKEEQNDK